MSKNAFGVVAVELAGYAGEEPLRMANGFILQPHFTMIIQHWN